MSLILSILVLAGQGNPNVSNVVITTNDGSVNVLPALVVGQDNKPAIQSAIDWCEAHPGRDVLRLPPGTWTLGSSLELVGDIEYNLEMVELINLDATFQGAIIYAGASTHPGGGGTRPRADNVTIKGLTVTQNACTSFGSHCCFVNQGDNWRLERVTVKNSKHEGLVSGGTTRRWLWDHVQAYDCGFGSVFRGQSGAGINCNGMEHVLVDCACHRCAQSYEHAGSRSTFIRCMAVDGGPALQGPNVGFNLGNAVFGLYRTRLIDCSSSGHPSAMEIGNPIGRVGGILVERFNSLDGTISFRGGKPVNSVPNPDEGPDLERSTFRGCTVHLSTAQGGTGFTYNTGPAATDHVHGRAAVDFIECEVSIPLGEPDWMLTAPFSVMGNVTGDVVFLHCKVTGPRGASKSAGDFLLAGTGASLLPPSMPNIKTLLCKAYKADGTERWFHPYRGATE